MDLRRLGGSLVISLTGIGLGLIALDRLLAGIEGLAGTVIVGAVLVLGAAFAITGPLAYRTTISSSHLLRIAGWNTLGVVATTAVLALVATFQAATGGGVTAPLLSGAIVVGVSAFAHVLIGFNDVRRIRAQTVAKQRQKAAVMNRFVRHNLKHTAQLLIGYGEQISADGGATTRDGTDLGQKVLDVGSDLSDMQTQISVFDDVLEESDSAGTLDLSETFPDQRPTWEERYPDGRLELDLSSELPVSRGEHLDSAFEELLDNAFRYGGDEPTVTVSGRRRGDLVEITITDTGDGFPENELAMINDDRTETQLQHSSGLGLWLAKWVIEQYGGTLELADRADGDGGEVTVRLPASD